MAEYITKITAKGQVTIPKAIREQFSLNEGAYLVFHPKENCIEVRKARVVEDDNFETLASRISERFKENGITPDDVKDAIQWARKKQ